MVVAVAAAAASSTWLTCAILPRQGCCSLQCLSYTTRGTLSIYISLTWVWVNLQGYMEFKNQLLVSNGQTKRSSLTLLSFPYL